MPAAMLKVALEIPESDQGEKDENPMPAPNTNNTNVSAAAATPPAEIAAHDTADWFSSSTLPGTSVLNVMAALPPFIGAVTTGDSRKKFQPRFASASTSKYKVPCFAITNDRDWLQTPTRGFDGRNVRLRTNVRRKLNGRGFVVAREETQEQL